MESLDVESWVARALTLLRSLEWWYYVIAGTVLLTLILVLAFRNRGKKRKARKVAPRLVLHAFQVSPLGRDAFFKLRNQGAAATISDLRISGRRDIVIKNAFAGHRLGREEIYGLLLEASGKKKITNDFSVELTYLDELGNAYRQLFQLNSQRIRQPKLIRFA